MSSNTTPLHPLNTRYETTPDPLPPLVSHPNQDTTSPSRHTTPHHISTPMFSHYPCLRLLLPPLSSLVLLSCPPSSAHSPSSSLRLSGSKSFLNPKSVYDRASAAPAVGLSTATGIARTTQRSAPPACPVRWYSLKGSITIVSRVEVTSRDTAS